MPITIMVWNKIYKKTLFDGIRFAEGYIHEDVLMTPTLFSKANKIGCLNTLIYNYNLHFTGNSTSDMGWNMLKSQSVLEMNSRVYKLFSDDSRFTGRIANHVAGIYFNTLLELYYVSAKNSNLGNEWKIFKNKMAEDIDAHKDDIKQLAYNTPYKIYFRSPWFFVIVKDFVKKIKQWEKRIKRQ